MKSTGVVRRIDDLGRIVIPKEVRRSLKIREGEELEIYLNDNIVCLKKFSKVADVDVVSRKILDVVSTLIDKTIILTDRDRIIAGSGELKKQFLDKEVSKFLEKNMSNRNVVVEKNVVKVEVVDGVVNENSFVLYPIICYGDVVGNVILLSTKSDISEFDLNIIRVIAEFLGKYVED